MKITNKQLLDFVYNLPTNLDYLTWDYGRISIEQEYMIDKMLEFFATIGIEVVDE